MPQGKSGPSASAAGKREIQESRMMTFARFDDDHAAIVIDVWGHTLHYQVSFAATELAEHDDEIIARAAQLWLQWRDTRVINSGDLATIRQAQERLLAAVRSGR